MEACRNRDLGMLDLLLKSHARDDECKALFIAAHAKDEVIVSKLLALKVRYVITSGVLGGLKKKEEILHSI